MPDEPVFDKLMLITGALVVIGAALFAFSLFVGGTQQETAHADAEYIKALEERIRPVARVVIAGQEDPLAEETLNEAVVVVEAVETTLTGPQIYNAACVACHGPGVGGAPKLGDVAAWAERIAQGMDVLSEHALKGYQGNTGFMPAKGGRVDLSDAEVSGAIEYMVAESQ